jgi:HK97 family phage major capsid protein
MNKGKKVSVQQYIARREQIVIRMNEIADAAENENKREFTDPEKDELKALEREMSVLDVRIASAEKTGYVTVTSREAAFDAFLREHIKSMTNVSLKREYTGMMTTGAEPLIPLTINDILPPLEEGLILNKVGLPLMTGLAGDYVWPTVGSIEADVAGEGVELTDKKVDFGKIKPEPVRVGVTVKITNQTITQTEGVAYEVVRQQLPQAMTRTLNKLMFTTDKTISHKLVGPFAKIVKGTPAAIGTLNTKAKKKAANYIAFAGAIPTYKELVLMRSLALLKGIDGLNPCYIMDEYTKGELESTERTVGSGRMIVENNSIAGVPIFTTNYINDEENTFIGFGYWGYEPLQGFGQMRFVIDPYTGATSDSVRLTLNADWSMVTLREEAFVLGKCASE